MSGHKADKGKLKLSLIPSSFIKGIGRVLTFGADKYAERNWEQGIDYDRVFSALQRHLWDWWGGERDDPESGIHHLYHAGCCLMFLATYEERGMGADWDGRKYPEEYNDEPISQGDLFTDRHRLAAYSNGHGEYK